MKYVEFFKCWHHFRNSKFLFLVLVMLYLKSSKRIALVGIIAGTAVWQICMGLALIFAYYGKLFIAKIFSWIGGVFILPTPGFLLLLVTQFSNLSKPWIRFSKIILITGFAMALSSPWGIQEYELRNGEYITIPGFINTIHLY